MKFLKTLGLVLLAAVATFGQGNLGSNSSPTVNQQGTPLPAISIAVCQPMSITAAQVISNVGILTTSTNPITAGFVQGMSIMVQGFSGADTYFNAGSLVAGTITGGWTILSVSSTAITFSIAHANASASTTGTVIQEGNQITGCAGLVTVYSDPLDMVTTGNPFQSDFLGNWNVFVPSGTYYVQFYSTTTITTMKIIIVGSGSSSATININGSPVTTPNFQNSATITWTVVGSNISGTASFTLPTKYTIGICETGLGDGQNAIPAATYTITGCYNDYGATYTITGIRAFTDNNGSTTVNAANDGATGLLTGAITGTNSFAAGTQSGTTTIGTNHWIVFTIVADGTTKGITIEVTTTR